MIRVALRLGIAYWAIVFTIGFALGIIRTLIVAPRIGAISAVLLELPLIVTSSWLIARRLLKHRDLSREQCAIMGSVALVLTLFSEAMLAALLTGTPIGSWARSLREMPGILGLAGQIVFAALPAMMVRR